MGLSHDFGRDGLPLGSFIGPTVCIPMNRSFAPFRRTVFMLSVTPPAVPPGRYLATVRTHPDLFAAPVERWQVVEVREDGRIESATGIDLTPNATREVVIEQPVGSMQDRPVSPTGSSATTL